MRCLDRWIFQNLSFLSVQESKELPGDFFCNRYSLSVESQGTVLGKDLAAMLKGGVIMDVINAEEAHIAEGAGACSVMALERVPADIRRDGGVARMSDPLCIKGIQAAVSIPVMAKVRIGHTAEAKVLESLAVDFIDESEVLTPADPFDHIDKSGFSIPFVCGAKNLGEALRRITEGAAMIRTKGEAGTGNIVEAVRHLKEIKGQISGLSKGMISARKEFCEQERISEKLLDEVLDLHRLPVVTFVAGGIATPADAALVMALGADGVFVGSGIFKSENPAKRANAIVDATVHWQDPNVVTEASEGLGEAMKGDEIEKLEVMMSSRGQ